jgi:hypothetical protein
MTRSISTRKAAADRAAHASAAVRSAITALSGEYQQFLRAPTSATLRTACDYFIEHPAGEIPPDLIMPALLSASGGDPRVTAYVKWQLLSALPEELDEATARDLIKAYRASPAPIPRPGMTQESQQKMDRLIQGARLPDEPAVIGQIDEIVEAARRDNGPILAYRAELYRRLPRTIDTFAAALDDLSQRAAAVADAKELVKSFCTDVQSWAGEAESPRQTLAALAKTVRLLADTKSPPYYDSIYWRDRAGVFAWHKSRSDVDPGHYLKDLAALLEEQSRQPAIDLTLKDKEKK